MPPSPLPLTYSRNTFPLRRRHLIRLAFLTFILVSLTHLARRYLPVLNHNLSTYSAQRACLAYTPPPNHLLHDSSDQARSDLPRQPGYGLFPTGYSSPAGPYALNQTFHSYLSLRTSDRDARPFIAAAFPFLHARTAPGGQTRLVAVNFHRAVNGQVYSLSATVEPALSPFSIPPRTDLTCYRRAGPPFFIYLNPTDHVRLYAGSPDPADPARFTIPLTINDTPYTLDGLLSPSDTVTLTPSAGPTTQTSHGPYWTPTNAPNIEYLWNGIGLY